MESYLNITIRVAKAQAEAAIASLKGQLGSLNSAMAGGGVNTDSSVRNVDRLTGSLRSAGYALTATFTAPLLAAGKGLLDFQLQNETAIADLKKVYGDNPLGNYSADITALQANFKALSNEFGVNQTEVIGIGAAWAQAGVQGAALATSVRNTLNTMIIGDLNAKDATTALISIQGQYGASASDLTKILADLNVVENTTAISMEGLITGFQRAAGAAANGGVTYRELAAMLASITPYAGTAAQAGNSLKTIISNLEAPSKQASDALGKLGINLGDTAWKSGTATDKLKIVAEGFQNLSAAQKNVEARALSGAFQVSRFDILLRDIALSLDKSTASQSRYGKAMEATTDPVRNAAIAQRELQVVLDSNPKKLQVLGDIMKNSLADVLVKLLPLILNIVAAVTSMVTWFSNLNPNVQKMIGIFLLLMAALGPVLLYLSAMRDVLRFGGDAVNFFLKPLSLLASLFGLTGESAQKSASLQVAASREISSAIKVQTGVQQAGLDAQLGASKESLRAMQEETATRKAMLAQAKVTASEQAFAAQQAAMAEKLASAETIAAVKEAAVAVNAAAKDRVATETTTAAGVAEAATAGGLDLTRINSLIIADLGAMWKGYRLAAEEEDLAEWTKRVERAKEAFAALGMVIPDGIKAIESEFMKGAVDLQTIWDDAMTGVVGTTTYAMEGLIGVAEPAILGVTGIFMAGAVDLQAAWNEAMIAIAAATAESMSAVNTAIDAYMIADVNAIMTGAKDAQLMWDSAMANMGEATLLFGEEAYIGAHRAAVAVETSAAEATVAAEGFAAVPLRIVSFFTAIPRLIGAIFIGIGPALAGAGEAILGVITGPIGIAVGVVVLAFALFRKQIIEGWNAVVGWFKNGAGGLADAFQPIVNIFDAVVSAAINAFNSLPQGIQNALQAVVNLVAEAAKAVYELFSYLNPWAHHSPSLVENVTTGMDAIQSQFKRLLDVSGPINAAYQDIKRFGAEVAALAGHAGTIKINTDVADIKKAGGGAAGVNAYLTETADVAALTVKQKDLNNAMQTQQAVVDRLDAGIKSYNTQLAVQNTLLSQLQEAQSAAQEGMNQAQSDLQKYQSYGISGQKAMSDAIFQSQQAEKSLQLQMMQIEDVTGPMQNVQTKMQALQGSMDALRGTAKSLRQGGAGADITGVYDEQTKAMQTQFDTTRAQVLQYDALQLQLTNMQRKTQELQLQDSLTYDPLTRQINDAATAMKELPFDQILKGVTDSKNALISYTTQYNDATKAVKEQQEVIKGITTARDALQARYDAENAKLDQLKKAYQDVGQAIADVNAELSKMTSSAQSINSAVAAAKSAAKGKAGSNLDKNFAAAAGGNFPTAIGTGDLTGGKAGDISGINKLTNDSIKNLQDRLKGLNPFKGIMDKWHEFTGWWGTNVTPNLTQFWDNIFGGGGSSGGGKGHSTEAGGGASGGMFGGLASGARSLLGFLTPLWKALKDLWALFKPDVIKLWDDLKKAFMQIGNDIGPKLAPLFRSLVDLFKALWPIIKIVAELLGGALLLALKIVADIFVNVLGPALQAVISIFGDVIQFVTGFIEILTGLVNITVGLLTGDWSKAWEGVKQLFHGIWDVVESTFTAIWHTIKGAGKIIWSTIWGLVTGIVDFFKWLYDILVGHSIIPDLVRAVIRWFASLPGSIMRAISALGSLLWSWAVDAFQFVIRGFTTVWNSLSSWLGGLGKKILSSLGNVRDLLYNVGSSIVDGLRRGLVDSWHFVTDKFSELTNLIPGPIKHLLGINSPSKVMAEQIGSPIAEGIAYGIDASAPMVHASMKSLANSVMNYKFVTPTLPSISSLPSASSFAGRGPTSTASMPGTGTGSTSASKPAVTYHTEDKSVTLSIDKLELPNIKSSADAQALLDSLEALANGSR